MKKICKIFLILLAFSLSSCVLTQPMLGYYYPTYDVEYLFEHDGVKVYHFRDRGNDVYFTVPSSIVSSYVSDSTKRVVRTLELEMLP